MTTVDAFLFLFATLMFLPQILFGLAFLGLLLVAVVTNPKTSIPLGLALIAAALLFNT